MKTNLEFYYVQVTVILLMVRKIWKFVVFKADIRVKTFFPGNIIAFLFEIVLSATTEEPW